MGSSRGETRRRRENFAILGPLNGDFTRENGQNQGPKSAKIWTLTDPPPRLEISDFLDLEDRAAGGKIFGVFRAVVRGKRFKRWSL